MKIDRGASPRRESCRISWTATALSIVLAVTAVRAQPPEKCDTLVPAQGQIEYRWRQNRCEGSHRSNVSSGDLELVSLLVGRLAARRRAIPGSRSSCRPFRRALSGPIRIRAVAIPPRTYYRMDATANAGGACCGQWERYWGPPSSQWSASACSDGLTRRQSGCSCRFGLCRVDRPAPPEGKSSSGSELSSAVDWVRWRAHVEGAPPQDLPDWQDAAREGLDAWKPVTVPLPAGAAAILRVDVRAKPQNSDQTQLLSVRVARPDLP